MTVSLQILPAAAWADRVAEELVARLRDRPDLRLCLPTGDTPGPVYAALAGATRAGAVSFERASIILLDEYLDLPPDSPARADGRLRRELLDHLEPPPTRFVPIDVDGPDPEAAARRHDAVAAEGLDLTLLGLGMNGHVGLNEPGSLPDAPTRIVRVTHGSRRVAVDRYGADRPPTAGITLGMDRLLGSDEVWLLVTGDRKSSILERALLGPEGPDCPASYLRRHRRLTVYADEPAAARLPPRLAGR